VPNRFNLGWHCADRWVEAGKGDRPAIYHRAGVVTYRQLAELSDRLVGVLQGRAVSVGERFLVRLQGSPLSYATLLAGMKLGAVPVPTAAVLGERELEHIVRVAEIRLAVVDDALAAPLRAIRDGSGLPLELVTNGRLRAQERSLGELLTSSEPGQLVETRADDPAFVLFTSGTTGDPKGVVHAHRAFNVAAGNPCGRWAMDCRPEDVVLQPHDLAWSYTYGFGFLFPLAEGAAVVAPEPHASAESVHDALRRHQPTILATVPTLLRRLLERWSQHRAPDLRDLRFVLSAGEPLPRDLATSWEARTGVQVLDHIGQVELNVFVANPPNEHPPPDSLGRALPGYEVAVLDDAGRPCTEQAGQLVVAADNPGLFTEYLGMPERYASVHRDGWYHTGDLAIFDESGYYRYVARGDDIIISRGYAISPQEVEATLAEHSAVAEVGVVGVPDDLHGQVVAAAIVLTPGIPPSSELAEDLRAHVRSRIASFKIPHRIRFVKELPRTATGKLRRRELM
jgi:2-aminobenzoate-CoA ligase